MLTISQFFYTKKARLICFINRLHKSTDTMKKTSKRFVLSSEIKNDKGFRVRTSGIRLADYELNPIMLFMHQRPKGVSKDEVLPIGNVVDIKLENGKLTGCLAFDETDDFAMKLYTKVENGTLRMVSAGLVPLTWSKDPSGEVWLETSTLKEISLVDIGSNAEAVAVTLYDEQDNIINLSLEDIKSNFKPDNTMKLIQLSALAVLPMLKLSADATPEEAQNAISELVTLANTQSTEIVTLKSERDDFKTKYEAEVKLSSEAKITSLLDGAVAKGKFVEGDRAKWVKLANADFDGTKDILDGMAEAKSVSSQIDEGKADNALLKMSYDELDKANQLVTLKAENLPAFKEKFKAKFGREYKEN